MMTVEGDDEDDDGNYASYRSVWGYTHHTTVTRERGDCFATPTLRLLFGPLVYVAEAFGVILATKTCRA